MYLLQLLFHCFSLELTIPIIQEGSQRVPTDLGIVSVSTAPSGVNVMFICKYSREIHLESESIEIVDVAISGATSGTGNFDFSITLNDGNPLSSVLLGDVMKVDSGWSLSTLLSLSFYLSECTVVHGDHRVQLVINGCYAGALRVSPNTQTTRLSSFSFPTFVIDGEDTTDQHIMCSVQICVQNEQCNKVTETKNCPSNDNLKFYKIFCSLILNLQI